MVGERHRRRLRGESPPSTYPFRIINRAGETKWVEVNVVSFSWEDRPGALCFLKDITHRKQVEEALRESEERYRTLVEESFDGIFIQKGPKIVFANKRLHEMLGYEDGDLIGLDHWLVYHPGYQELTRERAQARMRGEKVIAQYEAKLQRKDGSWFYGEVSARPITFTSDGGRGIQVWIKDIMGRKLAEE